MRVISTLAVFAALLWTGEAYAGTISITDLDAGQPGVLITGIPGAITLPANEFVTITLTLPFNASIPAGTHALLFTEPDPNSAVISDYITLAASPATLFGQLVNVTFGSDGSLGFNAAVSLLQLANPPRTAETGAPQDVTTLLGSNPNLRIIVQSGAVPEPASIALFGFGIAFCGGARMILRKRQS